MVDVARAAGVSLSTASRAMAEGKGVTGGKRDKVQAAARRLGYLPNLHARSLARKRSDTIGVVTTRDSAFVPVWVEAIGRFEAALCADGKRLTHTLVDQTDAASLIALARQNRWDGLMLSLNLPQAQYAEVVREVNDAGAPLVILGSSFVDYVDSVSYDRPEGVRLLLDHARSLGRSRVGLVGGAPETADFVHSHKFHMLEEDLAKREMSLVFRAPFPYAGQDVRTACAAARAAMGEAARAADIIIGANDATAMGVMSWLHEQGIRIPADIAVAGFDDLPTSACVWPPLTTVRAPLEALLEVGWSLLRQRLESGRREARGVMLRPRLVARQSTLGLSSDGRAVADGSN